MAEQYRTDRESLQGGRIQRARETSKKIVLEIRHNIWDKDDWRDSAVYIVLYVMYRR
jgi:hypothetical protein